MTGVEDEPHPATARRGDPIDTGRQIEPEPTPPRPAPTGERASEPLSRLRQATRALNQSPPVAQALEVLVRQALISLPIEIAIIGLVRPNRTLQIVATLGMGDDLRSRHLALGLDDRVPLTDAASRGVPVWLHDLSEIERRYPQLHSSPDRAPASASLPLVVDDRCVGALGIGCDRPAGFAADERLLLLTVADLCAAYLDRMGLVRVETRVGLRRRATDAPFQVHVGTESAPFAGGPAGAAATSESQPGHETSPSTLHIDPRSKRTDTGDALAAQRQIPVPGSDLALLTAFITNAPVALGLFDRNLRFVMVNAKLAEINGVSIADHIGRHVSEVVPALANQNERLMERVLRTSTAVEGVELSGPTRAHPDGGDWLVNYYPVLDAGGSLLGVGATVTDVTTTNRRERLLQEAFTERDHIARVLQQNLLPSHPPPIPGLSIDTLYLPAGEGNAVGGDFYDVFATDGSFHLVVGDVCGQGAEAAALTGFARDTLRATAGLDENPVRSLVRLNRLLLERGSDYRFITVAHLMIDRSKQRVATVALAGHPHPLLIRDGRVTKLGTPGSLLGVHTKVQISAECTKLQPGDLLLTYTDGLTDQARDPIDDTELHALAASLGDRPVSEVVDALRIHLRDRRAATTGDDTLVLVVRVEDR
jgi:PAS domain S-box-containing protein